MTRYIIRKMRLAHCKRGPEICATCREMDQERFCLLDIAPSDQGAMQRRVVQVRLGGKEVWREFDIVRTFEDQAAALAYAGEHQIDDIEL